MWRLPVFFFAFASTLLSIYYTDNRIQKGCAKIATFSFIVFLLFWIVNCVKEQAVIKYWLRVLIGFFIAYIFLVFSTMFANMGDAEQGRLVYEAGNLFIVLSIVVFAGIFAFACHDFKKK